MTTTTNLTAQDIFRQAYENRYTWDELFPGYSADVTMLKGESIQTGKVKIDSNLNFDVNGVDDPECLQAIKNQLWEITIHRVNHSFEQTHGENTFSFGNTDPSGALEILIGGKGTGNIYKVKDNTVCFVHRKIGNKIVNIETFKTQNTEQGYLALDYDSIYISPETGEVLGTKTFFKDSFEKVGKYYILSSRAVYNDQDMQSPLVEFRFSNICLIS
jgi:hypothetical protein